MSDNENISREDVSEGSHLYKQPWSIIIAPDFVGRRPWLFLFGNMPFDMRIHHTLTEAVYEIFDMESQVAVSAMVNGVRHVERAPIIDKNITAALRKACTQSAFWFEAREQ